VIIKGVFEDHHGAAHVGGGGDDDEGIDVGVLLEVVGGDLGFGEGAGGTAWDDGDKAVWYAELGEGLFGKFC